MERYAITVFAQSYIRKPSDTLDKVIMLCQEMIGKYKGFQYQIKDVIDDDIIIQGTLDPSDIEALAQFAYDQTEEYYSTRGMDRLNVVDNIQKYTDAELLRGDYNGKDITLEEAKSDVIAFLDAQNEDFFEEAETTKDAVLDDSELITSIAMEHRKCVNQYRCSREWSCEDACISEPGIVKTECPMSQFDIQHAAYELYKQYWIEEHTTAKTRHKTLVNYYIDCQDYEKNNEIPPSLDDWLNEFGFSNGCMYVCFDEFLDEEYRDKSLIYYLLENKDLIALYDADIARM